MQRWRDWQIPKCLVHRLLDIALAVEVRDHLIQVVQLLLFNADDIFGRIGDAHRIDVIDYGAKLK